MTTLTVAHLDQNQQVVHTDYADADAAAKVTDLEAVDIEAAIEAEGWCGCYADLTYETPVVVWPFGVPMPYKANAYLYQ